MVREGRFLGSWMRRRGWGWRMRGRSWRRSWGGLREWRRGLLSWRLREEWGCEFVFVGFAWGRRNGSEQCISQGAANEITHVNSSSHFILIIVLMLPWVLNCCKFPSMPPPPLSPPLLTISLSFVPGRTRSMRWFQHFVFIYSKRGKSSRQQTSRFPCFFLVNRSYPLMF